ncbi:MULTISPECIES: LCP family protein [unclassified Pseudonocardia]|uniref:LCP family protein n=1 Tax=unclassified Pseudonocardia TaxID=2619320 RepID=UPI00095D54BE|nr:MULTISPECIES: LCP family protein [unclassified Pseudonocardia]OLM16970.1 cell envelope-related transcriptional attenuator [Pseudonocardia sp. Ae707_Ps1]
MAAASAGAGTAVAGAAAGAAPGAVAPGRTGRPGAADEDRQEDDRPPGRRRTLDTARASLGAALGLTAASTVLPGSGHLALRRRRTGGLILGTLLAVVVGLAVLVLLTRRSVLLQNLLSTTTLTVIAGALVLGGIGWIAQVARTYALARPRTLPLGQKIIGTGTAALLCLTVAVPFGYGVELLNSQRGLLDSLFQGGGTSAAEALGKPRLNVLLLGSDAGDDRSGTRTDTMMVASIDTRSGRTTLFSLPRNIQRAEFPPGSPAAEEFPDGFHDSSQPLSGDYLLNGVFAYGEQNPEIAPPTPTAEPGLNLLQSTISYMTGLPIDYYLEVNMAGFSSMIDAVGGVTVNVGQEPIPVGGVTAFGRYVTPDRYIPPGMQTLNGEDALWFARSRRDGTDYQRMGRQRCLIQAVISETSATELIGRFQSIAAVTRDNVSTDMPQQVLPSLAVLADEGFRLESVAFDPSLPDPNSSTGYFVTADPDADYMREVVRGAIADPPPPPDPALAAPAPAPAPAAPSSEAPSSSESGAPSSSAAPEPASTAPQSVEDSCASTGAADVPSEEEQGAAESAEDSGSGTTTTGLGPVGGIRPDEY